MVVYWGFTIFDLIWAWHKALNGDVAMTIFYCFITYLWFQLALRESGENNAV